jgi:glutamate synthase domain-containing protein 1
VYAVHWHATGHILMERDGDSSMCGVGIGMWQREGSKGDSIPGGVDEGMCLLRERGGGSGRAQVIQGPVIAIGCGILQRVSGRRNEGVVPNACYLPIVRRRNYTTFLGMNAHG